MATLLAVLCLVDSWCGEAFVVPPHRRGPTSTIKAQPLYSFFNFGGGAKAGGSAKKAGPFTITVKQSFFKDAQLKVENGPVNLRKELLNQKVDLYPLQGKVYNCGGAGVCGTCAVNVLANGNNLR